MIADAVKSRGRSRHGCPDVRGFPRVSASGRHRSPPGQRGRKPTAGNDFSSRLNIARPTRNHPPRKHAGIGWGEHLARGPVPLPVPPRRSSRRAVDRRRSPTAHLKRSFQARAPDSHVRSAKIDAAGRSRHRCVSQRSSFRKATVSA